MTNQVFRGLLAAALLATAAQGAAAQAGTQPKADPRYVAKARTDSAQYPYTEADIHFMQGMIHHHGQALAMAGMAPTHGASPAVLPPCAPIINAQKDEINLISNWLRDRKKEGPDPTQPVMKMNMNGMQHDMLMPGMLTADEMKELDAARGKDFDLKFLRGMLKHHSGAVGMVKDLMG